MSIITKQESQLLAQHAIAANSAQGNTQKALAVELGIEPSRLSEAKSGSHTLMPHQRDTIIQKFGAPRKAKGQYIKTEIYNSVDGFIKQYETTSKQRLASRLYNIFTRHDYLEMISSHIGTIRELNRPFGQERSAEDIQFILAELDRLTESPEVLKWYKENKNRPDSPLDDGLIKLEFELENIFRLDISDYRVGRELDTIIYYLVALKQLLPGFKIAKKTNARLELAEEKEVVIVGDLVVDESIRGGSTSINKPANALGAFANTPYLCRTHNSPGANLKNEIQNCIQSKPDYWSMAELKLYLSESMEYHLWIKLSNKNAYCNSTNMDGVSPARNMVIKNLDRVTFLKDLELIRKWLGLPEDMNDTLKENIAKIGGYIPGAMVL